MSSAAFQLTARLEGKICHQAGHYKSVKKQSIPLKGAINLQEGCSALLKEHMNRQLFFEPKLMKSVSRHEHYFLQLEIEAILSSVLARHHRTCSSTVFVCVFVFVSA